MPQDLVRQVCLPPYPHASTALNVFSMIHNSNFRYFSASTDLSMTSWTTEESSAMDKCGHCDNCTHPVGTVFNKDVTLEAWQTLKIVQAIDSEGGRQTIAGLSDLARGAAGGSFEAGSKRKKVKEKVRLDYGAIAGGEVVLNKDVRDYFYLFNSTFSDVYFVMSCTSSLFKRRFLLRRLSYPKLTTMGWWLGRYLGPRIAYRAFTRLTIPGGGVLVHCIQRQRVHRTRRTCSSAHAIHSCRHIGWQGSADPLLLQTIAPAQVLLDGCDSR